MKKTCESCQFFQPVRNHPQGAGNCCVNPPLAVPMMGSMTPVLRTQQAMPTPMTLGLDPPVAPDRPACRHYTPEHLDA